MLLPLSFAYLIIKETNLSIVNYLLKDIYFFITVFFY